MVEDPITRRLLLASIPLAVSGSMLSKAFIAAVGWPFDGPVLAYSSAILLPAAGLSFLLLRSVYRPALRAAGDAKQRRQVIETTRAFAIACCGSGTLVQPLASVVQSLVTAYDSLAGTVTPGTFTRPVLVVCLVFGLPFGALVCSTVFFAQRLRAACLRTLEADSDGSAEPDKASPAEAAEKSSSH